MKYFSFQQLVPAVYLVASSESQSRLSGFAVTGVFPRRNLCKSPQWWGGIEGPRRLFMLSGSVCPSDKKHKAAVDQVSLQANEAERLFVFTCLC